MRAVSPSTCVVRRHLRCLERSSIVMFRIWSPSKNAPAPAMRGDQLSVPFGCCQCCPVQQQQQQQQECRHQQHRAPNSVAHLGAGASESPCAAAPPGGSAQTASRTRALRATCSSGSARQSTPILDTMGVTGETASKGRLSCFKTVPFLSTTWWATCPRCPRP